LALVAVVLPAGAVAEGRKRTSCPLATRVHPFEATTLAQYGVVLADGGAGDLDGTANGTCEFDVSVCVASGECAGEQLTEARVRPRGRVARAAREEAAGLLVNALATLPGAAPPSDTRVEFGHTPPPGACARARLRLAAEESARRAPDLSLGISAETVDGSGQDAMRRTRLGLRCVPAGADGAAAPACRASRGPCPDTSVPSCGNGVRDGADEACDGDDDTLCPAACRTDCSCPVQALSGNVAPQARVQASSEQPGGPARAVTDGSVGAAHEWIARGESRSAVLRLVWPAPVTVDRVVLHDRVSAIDNILAGTLVFDDGEAVPFDALPPDGRPADIMVGARTVLALTLAITRSSGADAGLGEIQVLSAQAQGPSNPPPAQGTTYYLSPAGSDSNPGTTADRPWRTFGKVLNPSKPLRAGDAIVLLDGTYTRDTTGLPNVDCRPGGNAPSGTAGRPIVIRAQHERRAHLAGNGTSDAFQMQGCAHWQVWGLHGSNADGTSAKASDGNVFEVSYSDDVVLQRLLAIRPNRTCPNDALPSCNSNAIHIVSSRRVLLEDSEAYDFHRHGISAFASRWVTVRRCYVHTRGTRGGLTGRAGDASGVVFYGASDSIAENCISEQSRGLNISGTRVVDGTPGGYRNTFVGVVTLDNLYGSIIRSRNFGGPVLPAGDNTVRDSVFARTQNVGVFSRGAANTLLENVTIVGTGGDGFAADEDWSEGAPCRANPDGCSVTARNVLSLGNRGKGARIDGDVVSSWTVEHSVFADNARGDYPDSENPGDASGNIRHSSSIKSTGIGLGTGKCLLWVPDSSPLKGAGKDGKDVGATVLYRYRDGRLTDEPLWDPRTGAFPCGARVTGVNDVAGSSCFDVHERLNVNVNGCAFPASYGAADTNRDDGADDGDEKKGPKKPRD
jgi:hypothetical protein